jgi:hypothetical protein
LKHIASEESYGYNHIASPFPNNNTIDKRIMAHENPDTSVSPSIYDNISKRQDANQLYTPEIKVATRVEHSPNNMTPVPTVHGMMYHGLSPVNDIARHGLSFKQVESKGVKDNTKV